MRKQNQEQGAWSHTTVGSVISIGLHKQSHTQGEWSQVPYEPPRAGTAVPRQPRIWKQRQGRPIPESVLSAAGPKHRSEVSFLLACTSKTTHKGSGPKSRTKLPAPGSRPRHIDFDRPA